MKEYTVYPGEYVPPHEINALIEKLVQPDTSATTEPLVNIDEYEHFYKIEVVIFGVSREEILMTVDNNVLIITAVTKDKEQPEKCQLHEFNNCCFSRVIQLPQNTDPEFIIAEYRSGVLSIYVPKSEIPLKNVHTIIAVY